MGIVEIATSVAGRPNEKIGQGQEKNEKDEKDEKVYRGLPAEDAKLINNVYRDICLVKPDKKEKRSQPFGSGESFWTIA